jgi:hypothetical protein
VQPATRVEIGCAADEKSLEKKLAESQKRHYAFTNKKFNVDGSERICILNPVF